MKNELPNIDPLEKFEKVAEEIHTVAEQNKKAVFKKYPLTFSFFSLVGFALLMYGLERTFDGIPLLRDHPLLVLLGGIIILVITGTVFKWLRNKEI